MDENMQHGREHAAWTDLQHGHDLRHAAWTDMQLGHDLGHAACACSYLLDE